MREGLAKFCNECRYRAPDGCYHGFTKEDVTKNGQIHTFDCPERKFGRSISPKTLKRYAKEHEITIDEVGQVTMFGTATFTRGKFIQFLDGELQCPDGERPR